MTFCFRHFGWVLGLAATALVAPGFDGPALFTLDLPPQPGVLLPAWLGQPVVASAPFASLVVPVTPPDPNASLLVTVFFQEQNGGFLRIAWEAASSTPPENGQTLPGPGEAALSAVLSENFYEGIGMNDQRSLLVPAGVMKAPGSLVFQTGSGGLGITRISLQWLEEAVGLNSPTIDDVLVTSTDGHTEPAALLTGAPPLAQDPAWHGHIVEIPITSVPLRIEQGVDFSVKINAVPAMARLKVSENGLPLGQHLVAWLNNQRAGVIMPAAPALGDPGYGTGEAMPYVGWREGTLLVPVAKLVAGDNTLQFSAELDGSSDGDNPAPASPLAVKDVVLQLAYPPAPAMKATIGSSPAAARVAFTGAATTTP